MGVKVEQLTFVSNAEVLQTDILEQQYGLISAIILRHDNATLAVEGADRLREVKLVDQHSSIKAYALTFITYDKNNSEVAKIDEEIRLGGLIGKTFRKHNYNIKRSVIDVTDITIPAWLQKEFGIESEKIRARLIDFYIRKDEETPCVYGTILEIHAPEFDLNNTETPYINPSHISLQDEGIAMNIIWENLNRKPEREVAEGFERAKNSSKQIVSMWYSKVASHLGTMK